MRHSPLRHPLAILRTTIGLTQKEMAGLVNRTPSTIQSVELGKLPLSEDLAMLIAEATGVDAGWLLEGDLDTPPHKGFTAMGMGWSPGEYTRADYEFHRAFLESPIASAEELKAAHHAALQSAKSGKKLVHLEIPVFKRVLLAKKKQALEVVDRVIVRNLKSILDQTATSEKGDLVRWKIRQLFETLASEHFLSALDQEVVADPSDQEVVVAELAGTHSPGNASKKTSKTKSSPAKAQISFDVAEEPSVEDRLIELSAGKPGGKPTVVLHPRAPRPQKKSKTK